MFKTCTSGNRQALSELYLVSTIWLLMLEMIATAMRIRPTFLDCGCTGQFKKCKAPWMRRRISLKRRIKIKNKIIADCSVSSVILFTFSSPGSLLPCNCRDWAALQDWHATWFQSALLLSDPHIFVITICKATSYYFLLKMPHSDSLLRLRARHWW